MPIAIVAQLFGKGFVPSAVGLAEVARIVGIHLLDEVLFSPGSPHRDFIRFVFGRSNCFS
jgi:hypothetical protein